jgi:hypothetical protein
MITANRRARATIAFFIPRRLAICIAQALSHDHFFEAKAWQGRLREMDEVHRHADRLLLLETNSDFVSAHRGLFRRC